MKGELDTSEVLYTTEMQAELNKLKEIQKGR